MRCIEFLRLAYSLGMLCGLAAVGPATGLPTRTDNITDQWLLTAAQGSQASQYPGGKESQSTLATLEANTAAALNIEQ
jgi:hypothetical protein